MNTGRSKVIEFERKEVGVRLHLRGSVPGRQDEFKRMAEKDCQTR